MPGSSSCCATPPRRWRHCTLRAGIGDASQKIRSGRVQPGIPPPRPADVPAELRDICATWGYLVPAAAPGAPGAPDAGPAQARVPQQFSWESDDHKRS
jgi:hypothetical protein